MKFINEKSGEREKKKTFKRELKNLTRNVGIKSSVHCFPSVSSLKTFTIVKVIWFLITATSWSYWMYQTYGLYQKFNKRNVVTSYKQEIDSVMEFPGNI